MDLLVLVSSNLELAAGCPVRNVSFRVITEHQRTSCDTPVLQTLFTSFSSCNLLFRMLSLPVYLSRLELRFSNYLVNRPFIRWNLLASPPKSAFFKWRNKKKDRKKTEKTWQICVVMFTRISTCVLPRRQKKFIVSKDVLKFKTIKIIYWNRP